MKRLFQLAICLILCMGCISAADAQTKTVEKQKPATSKQTTASSSAKVQTPASSTTRAYLKLSQHSLDFGVIPVGKKKIVEVTITNTGVKPLIITDTYTNCGCTSVDYPQEPIMPKKTGKLIITYDADEEGFFNKTITIYSNAENKKEMIKFQGIVSKD